jgi:hypothetical protein
MHGRNPDARSKVASGFHENYPPTVGALSIWTVPPRANKADAQALLDCIGGRIGMSFDALETDVPVPNDREEDFVRALIECNPKWDRTGLLIPPKKH